MRSRTFLHVFFGILSLAAAYHLGTRSASAEFGAGVHLGQFGNRPLIAWPDGTAWTHGGGGWEPVVSVPQSQGPITAFIGTHAITTTGYVWEYEQSYWQGLGFAPPPGATSAHSESWGSVKARYRGERAPSAMDP